VVMHTIITKYIRYRMRMASIITHQTPVHWHNISNKARLIFLFSKPHLLLVA
jgi:hypothetical protein